MLTWRLEVINTICKDPVRSSYLTKTTVCFH